MSPRHHKHIHLLKSRTILFSCRPDRVQQTVLQELALAFLLSLLQTSFKLHNTWRLRLVQPLDVFDLKMNWGTRGGKEETHYVKENYFPPPCNISTKYTRTRSVWFRFKLTSGTNLLEWLCEPFLPHFQPLIHSTYCSKIYIVLLYVLLSCILLQAIIWKRTSSFFSFFFRSCFCENHASHRTSWSTSNRVCKTKWAENKNASITPRKQMKEIPYVQVRQTK